MRKRKKLVLIFLTLVCLLNNYSMYVQAADSTVDLIERVERYTSDYDKDEINLYLEKEEYQLAKKLIEEAKDGYQERWDYIGLTTNDMYIAYQFKDYMTGDFFLSEGWWAKVTTWLSGLVYNDELKEYLAMESPGVNKYKDMLIYFMQETIDELVYKEYIEELKNSIENIGDAVEFIDNMENLSSQMYYKAIDVATYDVLYDMLSKAGSKEDVDRAILNFVNANPDFFTDENMTCLFKNNLSKLESKISKSLTFLGAGLEYIDTTISGIMEIDFFVANIEALTYYEDFLKNIQYVKYDSGDYVAPKDLRIAAAELRQELEGNFSNTITNIISEYGVTTALTGVELLDLLGEGMFSQILLGIGISSVFGNTYLDMSSLVKGVSYVQGYAYAGEIYSIVLERDKDNFLEKKSEEYAQQFMKDYEILWNIRLKGENSYLDMCDFSEVWKKRDQKFLRRWTDYASKKQFVENNIGMIESFEFKKPDFIKESQSINMSNQLNIFLSDIYDNGIWKYDANDYNIYSLMFFAFKFVDGNHTPLYKDETGNNYYVIDYETINDIIYKYFDIVVPHEQVEYILYRDNKFYFPEGAYEEWGKGLIITNNVNQVSDKSYKVTFDVAYIWHEDFDTGEMNPIEDWDIYYDYDIEQLKEDKFCEMRGVGEAILEIDNGKTIVKNFDIYLDQNYITASNVIVNLEEEIENIKFVYYDIQNNFSALYEVDGGGGTKRYCDSNNKIRKIVCIPDCYQDMLLNYPELMGYSAEYYYDEDEQLKFVFIYNEFGDQHRFYIYDRSYCIRYIDAERNVYDFPGLITPSEVNTFGAFCAQAQLEIAWAYGG